MALSSNLSQWQWVCSGGACSWKRATTRCCTLGGNCDPWWWVRTALQTSSLDDLCKKSFFLGLFWFILQYQNKYEWWLIKRLHDIWFDYIVHGSIRHIMAIKKGIASSLLRGTVLKCSITVPILLIQHFMMTN